MNHHEFRLEPYGQLDREAAYENECRYARGLVRRQVCGLGLAFVLKFAIGYFVYQALGWLGVAAFTLCVVAILFMRGTHAYPGTDR